MFKTCKTDRLVRSSVSSLWVSNFGFVSDFVLDHDFDWDDDLICGGRLDVASLTRASQAAPFRHAVERIRQHQGV